MKGTRGVPRCVDHLGPKGPLGLALVGINRKCWSITIGDRQSGWSTPLQDTPKLEYGWAYEIISGWC